MDWVTNNSIEMLQKSLDYAWTKQRIIQENIANAETPGYKAKYVTFEEQLQRRLAGYNLNGSLALKSKVAGAIDNSHIRIHTSKDESTRLDGNNVNTDVENVEMARTQLQYEYLVRQVTDQFTRLRMVIEGK